MTNARRINQESFAVIPIFQKIPFIQLSKQFKGFKRKTKLKMNKTISAVNTQMICLKNHIVGRLGSLGRLCFESFLAKNYILALLKQLESYPLHGYILGSGATGITLMEPQLLT